MRTTDHPAHAALRGLAALALGLCALAWPEMALALLLAIVAGYLAFPHLRH